MGNSPLSKCLRHVTVNGCGRVTSRLQFFCQFNGCRFGSDKNNHTVKRFSFKNAGKRIQLVYTADHPKTLTDIFSRGSRYFYSNLFGFMQVFLGNFANNRRHGCRKQGNLYVVRRFFKHPFHIINKTHAQHFIGFIKNKHLKRVKI